MRQNWLAWPKILWPLAFVLILLVGLLARSFVHLPRHPIRDPTAAAASTSPVQPGPPWIYGQTDARFTVVEYADLECPYCQAYFPILKRWIDANPEVNWQWHHLPLGMHEPATTREARMAECAGAVGGHVAFWQAVGWIYLHTRSDGQGLPGDAKLPFQTPALQACLDSTRADAVIHAEAEDAARDAIAATPTLRLVDHQTAKTLVLHGPVDEDVLLSAIDMLAKPSGDTQP